MSKCSCAVVLIGEETATRPWVNYEIRKAWAEGKGLLGIYIHKIKCPRMVQLGFSGFCNQGLNPFDSITLQDDGQIAAYPSPLAALFYSKKLSNFVECYNPNPNDAYNDIKDNIETLVERAINLRRNYK
jgi:hypothetical protein